VRTELQEIYFKDWTIETPIYSQTQCMAFPANFIYSLDATHMIMSAIACKEHGLDFAVAHDSYWTHACDVDIMNKVLREQFIKLHQQPLMENLRNEFIERYNMIPYSILKKVNLEETELLNSESATLTNSLDLADEAEELFDDVVSDPKPDDVPLEDMMIQTEEREPVRKRRGPKKRGDPRKERWIPIEFPQLPPRSESDITEARKNRCFFY
jgi:DNA-directed RNA polymerase